MAEKAVSRLRLSSEERRLSIVEAAMRLFGEKGFRGTTTRELAASIGVSEPVLYEHFKTKSDLYRAIIDVCTSEGLPLVQAIRAKYQGSHDDEAFFTELAAQIFEWHGTQPWFMRLLLFSNLENHELKELFQQRMACEFLDMIAEYIERRQREGGFRAIDPMLAARAYSGMISNYALMGITFGWPLPQSNEEIIRDMVSIFLEGLRNKGTI